MKATLLPTLHLEWNLEVNGFSLSAVTQTENKSMAKEKPCQQPKKASVATLVSDQADFQTRSITRCKESTFGGEKATSPVSPRNLKCVGIYLIRALSYVKLQENRQICNFS